MYLSETSARFQGHYSYALRDTALLSGPCLLARSVACWGNNEDGQATPPMGTFSSVSAGREHTCGLKTDGSVACWGDNEDGQTTPPEGRHISVSAGFSQTCGVRTDGYSSCWGEVDSVVLPWWLR